MIEKTDFDHTPQLSSYYFFVDESGDPNFYDRHGKLIVGTPWCSGILQLGMIKTKYPGNIKRQVLTLQKEILNDSYFANIPSIERRRNNFRFHATDDIPEIREKMFRLMKQLPFKAYIIVARKIEAIFQNRYNSKPEVFYDAMVSQLFRNQLVNGETNVISFEQRGKKNKQIALEQSIVASVKEYGELQQDVFFSFRVLVQTPTEQPCLQIADYINRAIQRMYLQWETRFFEFIREKVHFIWDIYDTVHSHTNRYTPHTNPFDIAKISPIKTTTELNP